LRAKEDQWEGRELRQNSKSMGPAASVLVAGADGERRRELPAHERCETIRGSIHQNILWRPRFVETRNLSPWQ